MILHIAKILLKQLTIQGRFRRQGHQSWQQTQGRVTFLTAGCHSFAITRILKSENVTLVGQCEDKYMVIIYFWSRCSLKSCPTLVEHCFKEFILFNRFLICGNPTYTNAFTHHSGLVHHEKFRKLQRHANFYCWRVLRATRQYVEGYLSLLEGRHVFQNMIH